MILKPLSTSVNAAMLHRMILHWKQAEVSPVQINKMLQLYLGEYNWMDATGKYPYVNFSEMRKCLNFSSIESFLKCLIKCKGFGFIFDKYGHSYKNITAFYSPLWHTTSDGTYYEVTNADLNFAIDKKKKEHLQNDENSHQTDDHTMNNNINNNINNINNNLNINITKEYIIDLYTKTINSNISSIEYEKLDNYINIFKDDLRIISYAIEYCKMYKAYNINYLCSILNNWNKSGYKNLEQIKENERKKLGNKNDNSSDNVELFDFDWLSENEEN